MKEYKLDKEDYFKNVLILKSKEISLVEKAMTQLIKRYNLKNKSVLSIATALGCEEYWFYKARCSLTLLDKGVNSYLQHFLNDIMEGDDLIYILGDIVDNDFEGEYDIIYTAGLPPLLLFEDNLVFSKVIIKFLDNIRDGGLFICQSYALGPLMDDPINVSAIKKQFENNGMILLNIYTFKSYSNVSLIIGFKGILKDDPRNEDIKITDFHGKSEKIGIIKRY